MFEKVRDIIVDTLSCDADKVTMEASLADDLGADSLDAVELNMALEDNLGVAITPDFCGVRQSAFYRRFASALAGRPERGDPPPVPAGFCRS